MQQQPSLQQQQQQMAAQQQAAAAAAAAAAQQQGQQAAAAQQQQQHKQVPAYDQLVQYREQLATDLQRVENQIADLEYAYFSAEYAQPGSVLKGFEGFLSSKEALRKRQGGRAWRPEDRLFSLSSRSSPVTREMAEPELDPYGSGGFGRKGYAVKGYAQKGKR